MVKPWHEVVNTDDFKSLTPVQRDEAEKAYFSGQVAPNVPMQELPAVWDEFRQHTTEQTGHEPEPIDPAPIVEVVEVAGQPINDDWTAFSEDSGTLGIPRTVMPQISSGHRGALVNFLKARGIDSATETVDPASLKPTQKEFSPEKVAKAAAFGGPERSILVSADNHVLDGHHQWLSKLSAEEPIKIIRLGAKIPVLLPTVKDFPSLKKPGGPASADAKIEAFETLMGEVSSALADMVTTLQAKGESTALDAIGGALADIAGAMESRKELPLADIVAAIKAIRITAPAVTVTNQVNPTPVQVLPAPVHIMPPVGCDFKVTPAYDRHGAITEMVITRIHPKNSK